MRSNHRKCWESAHFNDWQWILLDVPRVGIPKVGMNCEPLRVASFWSLLAEDFEAASSRPRSRWKPKFPNTWSVQFAEPPGTVDCVCFWKTSYHMRTHRGEVANLSWDRSIRCKLYIHFMCNRSIMWVQAGCHWDHCILNIPFLDGILEILRSLWTFYLDLIGLTAACSLLSWTSSGLPRISFFPLRNTPPLFRQKNSKKIQRIWSTSRYRAVHGHVMPRASVVWPTRIVGCRCLTYKESCWYH